MSTDDLKLEEKSARNPEDDFVLLEKLGEGSFGVVWKAMHNDTGKICAIKVVEAEDADDVLKEIQVLKKADCPQTVKYYDVKEKENEFYIVMEYCGGGSVSDLIAVCQRGLGEDQIALLARDTLLALQYRSDRIFPLYPITLTPHDILLTGKGEGKLADFGVSGQLSGTLAKRKTVVGSPFWMAPEVITENGHDYKADVWSLGITLIEMADRSPPLYNVHPMRAIFLIPSRPPPTLANPSKYSKEFNDFLARCLTKKVDERASAEELLKHDFITKRAKNASAKGLVEMIAEANERIMKLGSRAKAVGFEPEIDEQEATPAARKAQSKKAGATLRRTVRKKDRTGKPDNSIMGTTFFRSDETDSGSVVLHSGATASGTVVTRGEPTGTMVVRADATLSPAKTAPDPEFARYADDALRTMLSALEAKMESELKEIEAKYQEMRQPLLTILAEKKSQATPPPAGTPTTPSKDLPVGSPKGVTTSPVQGRKK